LVLDCPKARAALESQKAPTGPFETSIVTADLEALITLVLDCPKARAPDGQNIVYMASWYNGDKSNILDISPGLGPGPRWF